MSLYNIFNGENGQDASGNTPEMFDPILEDMKKNNDPSYDFTLYLKYHLRCVQLLCMDEGKEYDQALQIEGFEVLEYMLQTTVYDLKRWMSAADTELVSSMRPGKNVSHHILSEFTQMKSELWLDIASMIEDELQMEIENVLDQNVAYKEMLELSKKIKIDKKIENIIENMQESIKARHYEESLLTLYFTNKTGKKSLETFIYSTQDHSSFFMAFEKTRIKSVTKNCVTLRQKIHLMQLLRRYIAFAYEDWREMIMPVIEYRSAFLMGDVLQGLEHNSYDAEISHYIDLSIAFLQSPNVGDGFNWMIDFLFICLGPFMLGKNGSIEIKPYTNNNYKQSKKVRDQMSILLDMLCDHIAYREDSFYKGYKNRFTLQEMRIREGAMQAVEAGDNDLGKKLLRKVARHKGFFRYQYNRYSLDSYDICMKCIGALESKDVKSFGKYYIKLGKMFEDRQTYIVHEYPSGETVHYLENISRQIDLYNRRLQSAGSPQLLVKPKRQSTVSQKNATGRNDPCPCNSGKKYKKCCL